MRAKFQNAGTMLSITFFFSVLTVGLAATLPGVMEHGLRAYGVPAAVAGRIAHLPPIGVLFAAFLGYNPMRSLIPPAVSAHLSAHATSVIFGKQFFPHLIMPAFMAGLHDAFFISAALAFIAAIASLLRGERYIYDQEHRPGATGDHARANGHNAEADEAMRHQLERA
jgi:hypothetical protein